MQNLRAVIGRSTSPFNRNLDLQRYRVLLRLHWTPLHPFSTGPPFPGSGDPRAFTVSQLMTILEEARHSLILIEHDPLQYEHATEMTEYISKSTSDAAKEATVLALLAGPDTFLEELTGNADRVF